MSWPQNTLSAADVKERWDRLAPAHARPLDTEIEAYDSEKDVELYNPSDSSRIYATAGCEWVLRYDRGVAGYIGIPGEIWAADSPTEGPVELKWAFLQDHAEVGPVPSDVELLAICEDTTAVWISEHYVHRCYLEQRMFYRIPREVWDATP